MNPYGTRRSYGISVNLIIGLILLLALLIGINIYAVRNLEIGAGFYSYWLSSRILFAQGGNPYAPELFDQVLNAYPNDPTVSGFTLPLFSVIPVVLFSFIDRFDIAMVLWMIVLEAALIFAGIKALSAFRINKTTISPPVFYGLLLLSYPAVRAVMDGDMGILSLMFLFVALDAIRMGEDEFAGIMLAFATMKFSLTTLPILWILLWCLFNARPTVVAWFGMVLVLLILLATLFMTDWIVEFVRVVIYYYKYLNPIYFSVLIANWQPELGGRIGWAISGILIAIMLIEWLVNLRGSTIAFEWVTTLTLTLPFLIGIPALGKNLYLLWFPLIFMLDKINLRWIFLGKWFNLVVLLLFFAIPWIIHLPMRANFSYPVDVTNIIFPFIGVLLLYWNRWWTIRSVVQPY